MAELQYTLRKPFKVHRGAPASIADTNSLDALVDWLHESKPVSGTPAVFSDLRTMCDHVAENYGDYAPSQNLRSLADWAGVWKNPGPQDNGITGWVMGNMEGDVITWNAETRADYVVASALTVRVAVPERSNDGTGQIFFTDVVIPLNEDHAVVQIADATGRDLDDTKAYIVSITPAEDETYHYVNKSPKGE